MNVGLYTGTTGTLGQAEYQAVIAKNLANINTVGYKKAIAVFEVPDQARAKEGNGSTLNSVVTDYSQGVIEYTGNDLDVAITGKGFFVLQAENGNTIYSRKGQFTMSRDRKIVTQEGWSLMGMRAEIFIPKDVKAINIKTDGSLYVDGKFLEKIKVVAPGDDYLKLESIGASAFKTSDGSVLDDATEFEVAHRYLEKANVNAIDEMVNMIANMRGYQTGYKVTDSISDTLKKLIQLGA
ncbi:MAG: flagellar hook basal-body protein [Candidatus Brocadiaceae bacterium]|nr:flagellar hook basal-body protein [Candidatus Brocadiaceae bacterium]